MTEFDTPLNKFRGFLAGISVDLTGWKLYRRMDGGYEHRFAMDTAGTIRWCKRYPLPTDGRGSDQTGDIDTGQVKPSAATAAMDPGNDEQIRALEQRILDALAGRAVPVALSRAETITDPGKFAKGTARDYFSPCKWVRRTAADHLRTLGITISESSPLDLSHHFPVRHPGA